MAYAQEKAELESLLEAESAQHPDLALYLLRPPIVLGPHTVGAKSVLPGPLAPLNKYLQGGLRRLPVRVPALVPDLPVQFVHEDDVGSALLQCVLGAGPPGAYNIAGDGVLRSLDVAREFGLAPIGLPVRPLQVAARALLRLPGLPRSAGWAEVVGHPPVMDCSKAKEQLGWKPRFTGLEALQATLDS
jgi:nucleoside-diphosphate-sugar epimerase